MANKDEVWSVETQQIIVGPSGGYFQKVTGWTGAGVNSSALKYFSGGSLEICGTTTQAAFTGASFPGYLMGTAESIAFGGPAEFYLRATGATAIAYLIKGKTAGV